MNDLQDARLIDGAWMRPEDIEMRIIATSVVPAYVERGDTVFVIDGGPGMVAVTRENGASHIYAAEHSPTNYELNRRSFNGMRGVTLINRADPSLHMAMFMLKASLPTAALVNLRNRELDEDVVTALLDPLDALETLVLFYDDDADLEQVEGIDECLRTWGDASYQRWRSLSKEGSLVRAYQRH